jgi:hypothetical protein
MFPWRTSTGHFEIIFQNPWIPKYCKHHKIAEDNL